MANVAVFCASADVPEKYQRLAADLGTRLGQAGHDLVWGGQTISLMGAVSAAVRETGRSTFGFIPRVHLEFGADHDATPLVVSDTVRERKLRMEEHSTAFVVLPGGLGTADEFIETWAARYMELHDYPLIVLDPWDFYAPLFDWMAGAVAEGFVRESTLALAERVRSIDEALAIIDAYHADRPDLRGA